MDEFSLPFLVVTSALAPNVVRMSWVRSPQLPLNPGALC